MTLVDEIMFTLSGYWQSIIVSLIIVAGAVVAQLIIRHFLSKLSDSLGISKHQISNTSSISKIALSFISIILIIFQFSTTTGIIASAITLATGTIIGFASINTVGNAIAGLLILASRPFRIGDKIRISGDDSLLGDVQEITLIYTKIKTLRNELVSIPNQTLLQRNILNYSGLDSVAVPVEISFAYASNRNQIESLLLQAARNTTGILDDPNPYVILSRLDQFAAIYELRAYTEKPNEYFAIQSEIRKNIYDIFQRNGLDLTIPTHQIAVMKYPGSECKTTPEK